MDEHDTLPNGCAYCGRGRREHAVEWSSAAGWHSWVEPSDEQRLERLKRQTEAGEGQALGLASSSRSTRAGA